MSRDEITALARQAGLGMMLEDETTSGPMWEYELQFFADLVAQREREACAVICDQHYNQAASHCAQAIRLRGRI
jgi:hypothetical protein